jgi:hypothetical protein
MRNREFEVLKIVVAWNSYSKDEWIADESFTQMFSSIKTRKLKLLLTRLLDTENPNVTSNVNEASGLVL